MSLATAQLTSARAQLADYYRLVAAPWLLEFLKGRELFFSRAEGHEAEPARAPGRAEDLGELAAQGAVELLVSNRPAGFSGKPDWLVLALRPSGQRDWKLFTAAQATQALLSELGFEFLWKVSGHGGLHVLVPIHARQKIGAVVDFAQLLAELIAARVPEAAATRTTRLTRRVRIETIANRRAGLLVAPFSARAVVPWKISLPLSWETLREGLLQTGAAPEFDLTAAKENATAAGRLLERVAARPNDLEAAFITLEGQLQFAR